MTQTIASTQKSAGYDNPAYTARQAAFLVRAAGAAGVTAKYAAHAALILYGLTVNITAAGTSTYTYSGANGSSTVAINADQLSLIVVQNTGGTGSVALSTTSYGPWTVGGQYNASGTYTGQVGAYQQIQINTNTGTAGLGGVVVPVGASFYVQGGTDATAASEITIDYNIQPLAAVNA